MISLCIDRFEEDLALCETANGERRSFPRSLLPPDSREGDWLLLTRSGTLLPDPEETQRRRASVLELQKRLLARKKPPSGPEV